MSDPKEEMSRNGGQNETATTVLPSGTQTNQTAATRTKQSRRKDIVISFLVNVAVASLLQASCLMIFFWILLFYYQPSI